MRNSLGIAVCTAVLSLAAPAVVAGAPAYDRIDGTSGDDHLNGTPGPDRIRGFAGNDHVNGRDGRDGRDRLLGGPGRDTVRGNQKADRIWPGTGRDSVFGKNAPDTIYLWRDSAADYIDCGAGDDTVVYHARREARDDVVGCEAVIIVA